MNIQGELLHLLFDGKLFFPPVTTLERVLDCGYGIGSWVIAVAEQYPECEVSSGSYRTLKQDWNNA